MLKRTGQEKKIPPVDDMNEILPLFHHIHHEDGDHVVHHCGGAHVDVDPAVDYNIEHCSHGKHVIDKKVATGHDTDDKLNLVEVDIEFTEKCSDVDGGWHVESGQKAKNTRKSSVVNPHLHGIVGRRTNSKIALGAKDSIMKTSKPSLIKFRGAVYRLAGLPTSEQMDGILSTPPIGKKELTRSEQISLLKRNVDDWNQWYGSQDSKADLHGVDLHGADLHGADLRGADLRGADLRRTHYNNYTKFPQGFDPKAAGMILR